MGYSHYWHRDEEFDKEAFKDTVTACRKVIAGVDIPLVYESDICDQPPELTDDLIRFNGIGDDGHETFFMERKFTEYHPDISPRDDKKRFEFCKTAEKPYDLAVAACLIVAKHHLGDAILVSSDGKDEEWDASRELCNEVLGYGNEFKLGEDQ